MCRLPAVFCNLCAMTQKGGFREQYNANIRCRRSPLS